MKGLAMFLAVVGHSLPDAVKGFNIVGEDSFSGFLYHWIYSFHMPVFIFCAGFLFIPKLPQKKCVDVVGGRFRRLMVPYFFYSLAYLLLKTLLGSFADHPLVDNAFLMMFLGISPSFGCWFLWVLFVVSMVFLSIRQLGPQRMLVAGVLLFAVSSVLGRAWLPGNIGRALDYSLWFALGGFVAAYYDRLKGICSRRACGMAGFCLLTFLQFVHPQGMVAQCLANVLKTVGGILAIYALACLLADKYRMSLVYKAVEAIGGYSMDIYLLSMFVLVPMRILYVNFGLMDHVNYYVYVITAVFLGIWIPCVVSKNIVRRSSILRALLIGG